MTYLYVFRDDPKREISTDVEWACFRFQRRFEKEPSRLLVNPDEEKEFVDLWLKVEIDEGIQKGFFGVV